MQAVLEHGRFIMGPQIAELEAQLADYVGVSHTLTVASGTDSLEIALRALKTGSGDKVITAPFTWISTAEAIRLVGAMPVFVDITAPDFNIDIAPFFYSPVEAKSYISGLDLLVELRMHFCIAAYSSGVPVFPLAYSQTFKGHFSEKLIYDHLSSLDEDNLTETVRHLVGGN